MTSLSNGRYIVTWDDASGYDGGSGLDVRGQMFSNAGAPIGEAFLVNSHTSNSQNESSIAALSDGGFVVTWQSDYQDGDSHYYNIYGQRFDENADAVGAEFMVNVDRTIRDQHNPAVTGLANGEFVVTWTDEATNSRSQELGSGFDNSGWAYSVRSSRLRAGTRRLRVVCFRPIRIRAARSTITPIIQKVDCGALGRGFVVTRI